MTVIEDSAGDGVQRMGSRNSVWRAVGRRHQWRVSYPMSVHGAEVQQYGLGNPRPTGTPWNEGFGREPEMLHINSRAWRL